MRDHIPEIEERKIRQVIELGTEYMACHVPEKTSPLVLLSQQLRYISGPYWIIHVLLLTAVIAGSLIIPEGEVTAGAVVFHCAPILGLLTFPEVVKDAFYSMSELEAACKNSSGRIFSYRMLIVGILDILTLTLLAALSSAAWQAPLMQTVLHGLTPFLWMNAAELLTVSVWRIKSRPGYLLSSLIIAAVFWSLPLDSKIFAAGTALTWGMAMAGAVLLLGGEIAVILRKKERIVWN